jgi:hypothetical protein
MGAKVEEGEVLRAGGEEATYELGQKEEVMGETLIID